MARLPSQRFRLGYIPIRRHTIAGTRRQQDDIFAEHSRDIKNGMDLPIPDAVFVALSSFCDTYKSFYDVVDMGEVPRLSAWPNNCKRRAGEIHLLESFYQGTINTRSLAGAVNIVKIDDGVRKVLSVSNFLYLLGVSCFMERVGGRFYC